MIIICLAVVLIVCSCQFVRVGSKAFENVFERIEERVELKAEDVVVGKMATKTVAVSEFSQLTVNGAYEVHYSQGEASLVVTAPEKIMEHLTFEQAGDMVTIGTDGKRVRWRDVEVYVTSPLLNSLVVNGAVDFEADHGIVAEDFLVEVKGAGDVEINGLSSKTASFRISGAGDIDIRNLDTGTLTISVAGAGDVEVHGCADKTEVSISGVGSIDLKDLVCPSVVSNKPGVKRGF